MLEKLDKLVIGILCGAIAVIASYIAIVSLAHWAATGDMLFFRAFDPNRISVRPKIGLGSSLWASRLATPGTLEWVSSLLAYLSMAALAPVIGLIGAVKGFGLAAADGLKPVVKVCGMVGAALFVCLLLLRLGGYLFG
jgi:hypothetical protein